jgi:DNA-binding NarL/FixJ family response regulator
MKNKNLIRVLLIDDHPLFLEAIANAIEAEEGYEIVGQIHDGASAVKAALDLKPDIIVMDINLPVKNGIQAIQEIITQNPQACILAITSSMEDEKVLAAIHAGALGYILKDAPRKQFLRGLREVAQGNQFLAPEILVKLTRGLRHVKNPASTEVQLFDKLTKREKQILFQIGQGLTNKAIAQEFVISDSTVRVHVLNILSKLQLENRNQMILFAVRQRSADHSI